MAALLRGSAFITGAGSGIGQATAYAFAKHGVRQLAICDIRAETLQDTAAELRKRHGDDLDILKIRLDASKETSVRSAIDEMTAAFSRMDFAVNNAGITRVGPTIETPPEDWQKVISVNLNGVWLCQRAEIQQMLRQEPLLPYPRGSRGVIVNVASMFGLVAPPPAAPAVAYAASKHGVVGITKTDAVMYAQQGVRINAICPGYTATPMLMSAGADRAAMAGELQRIPQRRLGQAEEIADSIVYLASSMSSFMTGATLTVDGGYTAQ